MLASAKIKNTSNSDFSFYSLFLIIGFLLFINGLESFISSSEFWSIYLSQKIFTHDPQWISVYLKPLFHALLSTIYLLQLNDFYHIVTAKIFFALNGILQFTLVYNILSTNFQKRFLNLGLTCFLFSAPFFISHMNQVRSDQLALTFFLLLISFEGKEFRYKYWVQLGLLVLFPLIAFKHIYFSILCFPILPWKKYYRHFRAQSIVKKIILLLTVLNLLVWGLYQSASALHYFLETYNSEILDIRLLFPWTKTEWFYIYFSFLPYLFKDFRIYLREKELNFLFPIQLIIISILMIHPQKLAFFIASFLPVLYLSSVLFCQFLNEKKIVAYKFVASILLIAGLHSVYTAKKYYNVFTLNNPQLIAIDRISNIITKNNFTYLDGMGILPRAKNIGCFVSPDDEIANKFCIQKLSQKTPDAVIITNRLMSLPFDFVNFTNSGYTSVGPNVYLRDNLIKNIKLQGITWPSPTLIFSYEQIY